MHQPLCCLLPLRALPGCPVFQEFGEKKLVTMSNCEGESSTLSSFSPELIPLVLAHVWLWPKVVKASGPQHFLINKIRIERFAILAQF